MAIGLGRGGRAPNPHIAALARAMKARGGSSLAAGAAEAAPAAAAPPAAPAGGKPPFHPLHVLNNLKPGQELNGKELARAAKALTVLETRPIIHGYKEVSKQLGEQKAQEAQGLSALGARTEGNVGSVYKNIAASEAENMARQSALGQQLTSNSANIAKAGNAELAGMQTGALGDYEKQLQMRGSPAGGGAQEALAQAVASQQATQNTNNQAAQQFAGSQAANSASLAGGLAGAAQLQGGAAVGSIGRDIIGRTSESNAKFDQNIQSALSKLGEAKATKGATFTKNLLGLREGERKFKLGEQAVQGEKSKLGLEAEKAAETQRHNEAGEATSAKSAQASMISALASQWNAHHPGASSNEQAKHAKEVRADVKEVHALIPSLLAEAGHPPKTQKELNQFIGFANTKASATPALVQHVLRNWWLGNRTGNKQGHVHR